MRAAEIVSIASEDVLHLFRDVCEAFCQHTINITNQVINMIKLLSPQFLITIASIGLTGCATEPWNSAREFGDSFSRLQQAPAPSVAYEKLIEQTAADGVPRLQIVAVRREFTAVVILTVLVTREDPPRQACESLARATETLLTKPGAVLESSGVPIRLMPSRSFYAVRWRSPNDMYSFSLSASDVVRSEQSCVVRHHTVSLVADREFEGSVRLRMPSEDLSRDLRIIDNADILPMVPQSEIILPVTVLCPSAVPK